MRSTSPAGVAQAGNQSWAQNAARGNLSGSCAVVVCWVPSGISPLSHPAAESWLSLREPPAL